MANLGLKVADVISKFYDVKEDDNIRGLYEVRKKDEPNGDLLWYFFSSNNATYHSSGKDCVIRDINQSNSRYLDRLIAAFEKAKNNEKKIFWLVLVYGEGIGLIPQEMEWMASIETKVDFNSITASLRMTKYPIGKGRDGEWKPCCKREEQDKYCNTTFMSCKDEDGKFTDAYMKDYFELYDNRPYHDIVEVKCTNENEDEKISIFSDEVDDDYTINQLAAKLKDMYENADDKMQVASIHLFGIKYGKTIIKNEYKSPDIIKLSGLNDSYSSELQKGLNVYKCIAANKYNVSFENKEDIEYEDINPETSFKSKFANNRIIFGAPGTGKSYHLKEQAKELLGNSDNFERVTFHPDYTYSQFVGTYKPVMDSDGKSIRYDFVPGPFMRVYVDALRSAKSEDPQPYLLLIEEINRAKVAAVFGDVFQLLDRNERGVSEYDIHASEDIRRYLAKELGGTEDNYKKIKIPNNMFIWSTMNSADQGVYPMDTAFKRRWDFEYLGINQKEDDIKNIGKISIANYDEPIVWNKLRKAINAKLSSDEFRINEDKLMGPYFLSKKIIASDSEGMIINTEKFIDAFKSKVIMYLYEDAVKQSKRKFFDGCDSSKYSSVCEAFDKVGMDIFGTNFVSLYYEEKGTDAE